MIQEIYRSSTYAPERVTGRYVRCQGRKPNYLFRVSETEGKNGTGATLREYVTAGNDIPETVRAEAIRTKLTTKWI